MLFETHCHLHDPRAFPDPAAELAEARAAGVGRIIVVGVEPDDWDRARRFAEEHDDVDYIAGWHPNYAAEFLPATMRRLEGHLDRALAIGEIGLDGHHTFVPWELQLQALRAGLSLARESGKPCVYHGRDAYGPLLDEIETRHPEGRHLFHCWTATPELTRRALRLPGAIFGVDGPVTYKKADELRESLREIGPDRVVLETDSPYLAPVPFRGRPNRPAYLPHVARGLAETLGLSFEETAARTTATATAFFGP